MVAAMIALLTSATFIGYAQTWRHWSLRQNARQLYLAARYARVLAISSQQPCQLIIDRQNGAFYVAQESAESKQVEIVSGLWSRPVTLAEAVTFERVVSAGLGGAEEAASAITFRPDGSADAAMVQVGNGDRHFTVQISAATARATLLEGAVESYVPDQIDLDEML